MAKPKTELQELFVERVLEELEIRGISGAALAKLTKGSREHPKPHAIAQASISRILTYLQDPTLEKVYSIADALGIPPWYLLMQSGEAEQKIIRAPSMPPRTNVAAFPTYPKIFKTSHAQSKKALAHKGKK